MSQASTTTTVSPITIAFYDDLTKTVASQLDVHCSATLSEDQGQPVMRVRIASQYISKVYTYGMEEGLLSVERDFKARAMRDFI